MQAYFTIIKGISKQGRPYYRIVIEDGLNTINVFDGATAIALALSGLTPQQLVEAKDGVVATFELNKI